MKPIQICKAIWCNLAIGLVMISIISLEASSNKNRPAYATLIQVLAGVPQKPVAN